MQKDEENQNEIKLKKIKDNQEKFFQNNEQIKKLINFFGNYLKKVKNGFKVNKFFNELDEKVGTDLKSLVKLSNERYKSVKSGNTIFQVLEEQSPVLCTLIHSALNDPFYKTKDILEEKNKIKGKVLSHRETSGIAQIRNKIISKPMTAKVVSNSIKNNYSPIKEIEKRNLLLPDKENITGHLEDDKEYLSEKFNEYHTFLTQKKSNLKLKEDDAKKKFSVNLDSLKYVSSKTNPVVSIQQKIKNNEEIDTQKLIAIQKAQKHVYEKRLKKKEILDEKFSKLIDNDIQIEERNELNIIKNEILKTTKFKENILVKAAKLNQVLNDKYLPKVEDYEVMIQRNNTKNNLKQPLQQFQKMMLSERVASNNIKDRRFKAYKDNYEKKKEEFKVKDDIEQNMQKRDGENKESRRKFLKEIAKVPRTAQIFIDNYSLRDDETNRNIVELNRILKKQNNNKTKVNEKIDQFLIDLEERKKNKLEDIDGINEGKFECDDTNNIRIQIKKNLENQPENELDNFILDDKKTFNKLPIDMSNQTVTENYNVFKQFKDRILDKKQEEIYKIKPMTAGEFLNEKPKTNNFIRGTNNEKNKNTIEISKDSKPNTAVGVEGLSKLLKEDPKQIMKILEQQKMNDKEFIHNFNKLRSKNKIGNIENPLIDFDIKKEDYFNSKNKANIAKKEIFKNKNIQEHFKHTKSDFYGNDEQMFNLIKNESYDSNR